MTAGHQSARVEGQPAAPRGSSRSRASSATRSSPRCSAIRCSSRRRCRSGCSRRSSIATRAVTSFGNHVDNAIRQVPGTPHRSAPISRRRSSSPSPDEYDGGELVVEDTYGVHSVKLPAGHLVLYPSTSLHHVRPVTRGARVASFFWIQSMVRDDGERTLLFDLDSAIQRLTQDSRRSSRRRAADGRVPQPAPSLGRGLACSCCVASRREG